MSAADIFGKIAAAEAPVAVYETTLRFVDKVVGGVPDVEAVVRSWIMANMKNADEREIDELVHSTMQERSLHPELSASLPTIKEEAEAVADKVDRYSVNGFKRHPQTGELCLEGRCLKAMLKEATNVAYPNPYDWPGRKTRENTKGKAVAVGGRAKSMMKHAEEMVIVPDVLIGLGVKEPSSVETRVKHFEGKFGEHMSAFNRAEVVYQPTVTFRINVVDDFIPQQAWARIWTIAEGIGIGADRHRSDGMFELLGWDRV